MKERRSPSTMLAATGRFTDRTLSSRLSSSRTSWSTFSLLGTLLAPAALAAAGASASAGGSLDMDLLQRNRRHQVSFGRQNRYRQTPELLCTFTHCTVALRTWITPDTHTADLALPESCPSWQLGACDCAEEAINRQGKQGSVAGVSVGSRALHSTLDRRYNTQRHGSTDAADAEGQHATAGVRCMAS